MALSSLMQSQLQTESRSRKHRVPNKTNLKRSTPRYTIMEKVKSKEIILKATRRKQISYKEIP